jgi:tetratricopeptide (TPR) repeat protein
MESLPHLQATESRLSAWCKGVIESVWLAAVGVLPFLLNPRATLATHEAPKLAFLKMLALLGLAAWGVLLIERRVTGSGPATPGPIASNKYLMLVLTLLMASVAVSTGLSIDPMTSFWGSPEINQGALTWAAELLMLVLVGAHLRTREQIRRLVTVVLLSSFAVSLIGISQWLGWDPMRSDVRGGRIFSTIGNPIYLAEYLMMIFPLTIWRIIGLVELGKTKTRPRWLTLYSAILLTQAAAFACTGSRGPMIASLVSFFTFALLYALLKNWKTLHRSLAVAAVCMALVAAGAGTWLKQQPAASGTQKFAFMGERGDSGRGEYWRKASEMLFLKHQETPPALIGDSWKPLRMWIGYGPETLTATLPFYHANADTLVLESWFHNLVWDYWHSFGLLGLGVFLTFGGLIFFLAYKRMGFIDSRSAAIIFWAMPILSASVSAVVLPFLVNNAGFAGMGAVLGFVAGLILFPTWFGKASMVMRSNAEHGDGVLIAALLAGLAGYLADQAFVFPTACSSILLWIYSGIVVVVCGSPNVTSVALRTGTPDTRKNVRGVRQLSFVEGNFPVPAAVALVSACVIALLHVCINSCGSFPHRFSTDELLSTALFNTSASKGPFSLMILPVALYWISASLALAGTASDKNLKNSLTQRLGLILGLSGAVGFLFAVFESFMIAQAVPLPEMRLLSAAALDRVHDQELLFLGQIGILISLVILTGCKLAQPIQNQVFASRRGLIASGVVFTSAIMLMWFVILVPERAGLFLEEGLSMQAAGHGSLSSGLFKQALSLNPRPFVYRSMLSESLITDAEAESDNTKAFQFLVEAESVLKDGSQSRQINRTAYYLGRVYFQWALREAGTARAELARKASESYDVARAFEPHTEPVWSESGMVDLLLKEDAAAAKLKFERASQLASRSFIAWAEFHSGRSLRSPDARLKQQFASIASQYFDGAIQDPKLAKESTSRARLGKGLLQLMTNQVDAAISNLNEAVELGVDLDQWEIELMLAEAFMQKADRTAARKHLERAVEKVPPEKKQTLRPLQAELGVR